ncbi:MAG TPA: hypothetical protein VLC46_14970 [Thermoanaerobaculia bacterium]|jgi:hypothetical protein|nr:hypothetical protein [Thermoanaerobaculia bacterium]
MSDTVRAEAPRATRKRVRYEGVARTRLERFIRSRGLALSDVAQASHVCRQRLKVWRRGESSPLLSSIRKLVRGIRELTADPKVRANDLFPLDDDE